MFSRDGLTFMKKKPESKLKQERAVATREMIIQGAAELFSEFGYPVSSISDIASHTGVTQGAIYFHFTSKNAIGEEIIKRQHELSIGIGQQILAEKRPGAEKIVLVTREVAHQLTTQPIVRAGLRLSTESAMFFPGYAKTPYLDWIKTCEDIFREGIADGDVKDSEDPRALGRLTVNMFVGTQVVSAILTNWEDLFDELPMMWKKILPSIIVEERQGDLIPKLLELIKE
jgi:AcrR family transcriptional regulator